MPDMWKSGTTVVALMMLVALSSCSATQPRGQRQLMGEMLEAKVTQAGRTIEVSWKFTNHYTAPVWLPVAWGTEKPPVELPFAFVVPPGDLLFVFGQIVPCTEKRLWPSWGEVRPGIHVRRLAPGESLSGTIKLSLPHEVQHTIRSPWEFKSNQTNIDVPWEREITVSQVSAIQMAAQYWLFDPREPLRRPRNGAALEQKGYARTLANAVIFGIRLPATANDRARDYWRVSVSKRILVSVPLKSPIELYVEPFFPLPEEEVKWYLEHDPPPEESVFDKGVEK